MTIHREHKAQYQASKKWINGIQSTDRSATYKWEEYRVGADDPKWRDKVARMEQATNAYSCFRVRYHPSEALASVVYYDTLTKSDKSEALEGFMDMLPTLWEITESDCPLDSAVSSLALERFVSHVNDAMSPVKGMVFLGEIMETVRMLKKAGRFLFSDLSRFMEEAKKLTPGRRFHNRITGLWLEYALGWMPLLAETENALTLLAQVEPKARTVRGTARSKTAEVSTGRLNMSRFQDTSTGDVVHVVWNQRYLTENSAVVKGAIKTSLLQPGYASRGVAARWGFTLREFVPTIWELIPYSFVVDYFSNIGAVINGVFFDMSVLAWYFRTQKAAGERNVSFTKLHAPTRIGRFIQQSSAFKPDTFTGRGERLVRDKPGLFVPEIRLQYPALDSTKWATLASLLINKSKGF